MRLMAAALALTGCGATMQAETRAERCGRIVRSDPVVLSGESPDYTRAALDAGVHGPVRAKCWISDQGIPVRCTLIDHVASMDASMLRALWAMRYRPALVDGSPTMVAIEVTLQLKPPPPGWAPRQPDPTTQVIPLGMGMERPTLLSSTPPTLPAEERGLCASGLVLARCVLNMKGTLDRCRIVASTSRFLSKSVLDALPSYRYTPVTFQGRAVNVEFTIPIQFKLE